MELFINAIKYCENGLRRAIENDEEISIIKAWKSELEKWRYNFIKYYQTVNA